MNKILSHSLGAITQYCIRQNACSENGLTVTVRVLCGLHLFIITVGYALVKTFEKENRFPLKKKKSCEGVFCLVSVVTID